MVAEPGSREAVAEALAAKDLFGIRAAAQQTEAEPPPSQERDGGPPETDADVVEPSEGLLPLNPTDEHPSDDEDADPDAVTDETEEPDDEGRIESLNELARSLDTDVDTLLGLRVTAKVDGEEHDVSLGDVLKSYRLESVVNKRSTQLGEQRKALQTEHAEKMAAADATLEEMGQFLEFAQQQITGQVSQVNLAELAEQDPALATQRFMEMEQAKAAWGQKMAEFQAIKQQRLAQVQQAQIASQQAEQQRLTQVIPEWLDQRVMSEDVGKMEQFLLGRGVPRERLQAIQSADELAIIRDAMLWNNLQAGGQKVLKKVQKAPKGLKSSSRETGVKLSSVDSAKTRLKQSGSKRAAVEVLKAKRAGRAKRQRRG